METLLNTDLGPYRLVKLVRRGGMAAVYTAYQPSLNRFVAVKVLEHHHDRQFVERFKAEAQLVAKLQHPNILQVYDYGEQHGVLYLASQYVEHGASLADVGKPMPLAAALAILERLLAALEHAHARGIVHRDVKPSNVLLPAPDWPLLADFGIAKLLDTTGRDMTAAGQVIGTAAYRVAWRDKVLRSDLVIVAAEGLPPPEPGQVYAAWLSGAHGDLALGALRPGDDGKLIVFYVSPDHANLLESYDRVSITSVPEAAAETELASVILTRALPKDALVHLRHVLASFDATPNRVGFALGLRQEAETLLAHARN